MTNSSFVGTTQADTRLPVREIRELLAWFASASSSMPSHAEASQRRSQVDKPLRRVGQGRQRGETGARELACIGVVVERQAGVRLKQRDFDAQNIVGLARATERRTRTFEQYERLLCFSVAQQRGCTQHVGAAGPVIARGFDFRQQRVEMIERRQRAGRIAAIKAHAR